MLLIGSAPHRPCANSIGILLASSLAKLPRVSGKEMVRFLEQRGFTLVRIRSHHFFRRKDRRATVPVHGNLAIRIGTLRRILRDIDVAPATFTDFFQKR